jgi:hypothetical protein
MLSVAQSAVTKHAALDGAILHLLQWSKTMTRKTYIGTPHRGSISGQSLVTVCDGQKSQPLPLRLDLFQPFPDRALAGAMVEAARLSWPSPYLPMLWATMTGLFGCTSVSKSRW